MAAKFDALDALRKYIDPNASRGQATDTATEAMREAILDGVLAPSTWLREDYIADALGVSRTPIREALRRLADEGLVVKTAHHGTLVASLSLEDVLALYVVRESLEGLAARLAAGRQSSDLVAHLTALNDELRRFVGENDLEKILRANLEFHRALREASSNPHLDRFLLQVERAVRRLPAYTFRAPGRLDEVLCEHDAIIEAISNRDPDAAERLAKEHILRARETRLKLLLGS